jgi:hypothetical protein
MRHGGGEDDDMKTMMKTLLVATALVGATSTAHAAVANGVTGSLTFGGGSTNYYNPANGFVPAGYGNTGGTTVAIGAGTEFGFADSVNTDTADFTATSLLLKDVVGGSANNWTQIFTASQAGFFNNIALGASNFSGLTYLVTGNTLRVDWIGTESRGTYAANFSFGAAAVPEPATWAMMLVGFGMMGAAMRYRRRSTTTVYA